MNFLGKYFHSQEKRSEIGAVCASSGFLADMIVNQQDIEKASVIVELGAGTGVFTKRIFELAGEVKKEIFIVEKDRDFYEHLLEKFPHNRFNILNVDVCELEDVLKARGIDSVDLVISGLPFRSLGPEIFIKVMAHFLKNFSHEDTIFRQFSYFPSAGIYRKYFAKISKQFCFFNVPPATVFTCAGYKKEID